MRSLVTALALAAPLAFSLPAVSQVAPDSVALETSALLPSPDATGLYVEAEAGGGYGSSLGVIVGTRVSLGYRLPSGLSLGATATHIRYGDRATSFAFGPDVRYSQALDARTTLNLRASGTVGFTDGLSADSRFQANGVGGLVEASATRRFGLGGGVTLAATGGAYGGVSRAFAVTDPGGVYGRDADVGADAGVLVGLQAEFNALGGRFAVGPYGGFPVMSTRDSRLVGAGTGLYRGTVRSRGLITYMRKTMTVSLL